jgi:hypothetical protein
VADSRVDADALILFVDYLQRLLGQARDGFSIDECVARVLDENFVPDMRYAGLLVAEVPPRQRLQVALAVYRRKTDSDGTKLRYFFESLLDGMSQGEQVEFWQAVSAELRESNDDAALRALLQIANLTKWMLIDEAARIRTENRLIRNLNDGRYVAKTAKCTGGALATWSRGLWPQFVLRDKLVGTILEKLRSSSTDGQNYVLKFCFDQCIGLLATPPAILSSFVVEQLKAGDVRFKSALEITVDRDPPYWGEDVASAFRDFQAADPVEDDDDLPF